MSDVTMTDNYLKSYRILGVKPGVNWKQLRQAYKKLVNVWHPDRFQQDARRKRLAEEKTKDINQAYKELAEYHKKFGVLPLPAEEENPSARENSASPAAQAKSPTPEMARAPEPATAPAATTPKRRMSQRRARTIAAMALLGSVYFIWQFVPWQRHENAPSNEEHGDRSANHQHEHETESSEVTPAEKRFTVGSPLGEVYAIQGVPTKTEKDIWYYGNSKIYFAKGKVVRWDEKADSPLRADVLASFEKADPGFFGRGSSKEEVLTAQGSPDRDAGSVWDYGLSRVYFENGRVTGWHEAQYSPLRVRK